MTSFRLRRFPVVGFDIGGTNIRAVLVGEFGEELGSAHRLRAESPDAMVDAVVEMVGQLSEVATSPIAAVGMGIAGIVDTDGVVRTSPNIPSLNMFPMRAVLEDKLGVPVVADNDATTATLAEAKTGAGIGYDDLIFVALGTGIGGGLVVDGKVRRGATGFAGEIGHMIVDPNGPQCVCGRIGCWEQLAAGSALGRMAREAAESGRSPELVAEAGGDASSVKGEHLSTLIDRGDPVAQEILSEFGRNVAIGLNNLVNVLDPSAAIIGGGLAAIGEPLLGAIRRGYLEVMVDHDKRDDLPILLAVHGGDAGALGAALLAGS